VQAQSCVDSPKEAVDAPVNEVVQQGEIIFDSVQKLVIDTLSAKSALSIQMQNIERKKIPYPLYSPTDSIDYWFTPDKMGRISMNMHKDSTWQHWPFFWIYDGEVIRIRLRHMDRKADPPFARESMVYLKDGQIMYCEERRTDLIEGEMPGTVTREKYERTKRSAAELEKEYKEFWVLALEELRKNNALPEWLKQ
jgi:hypothetical protein